MPPGKKGPVRGPCYKLQMSFCYPAVPELKSFVCSCVFVGQQYSLNFILVSYFYIGVIADIFLLAAFFTIYSLPFAFLAFVYFTVCPLSSL